jgi:hypothetical protein
MYPATLGFWLMGEGQTENEIKDTSKEYDDITVIKLKYKNYNPDLVRSRIEEFLNSKAMHNHEQVRGHCANIMLKF